MHVVSITKTNASMWMTHDRTRTHNLCSIIKFQSRKAIAPSCEPSSSITPFVLFIGVSLSADAKTHLEAGTMWCDGIRLEWWDRRKIMTGVNCSCGCSPVTRPFLLGAPYSNLHYENHVQVGVSDIAKFHSMSNTQLLINTPCQDVLTQRSSSTAYKIILIVSCVLLI